MSKYHISPTTGKPTICYASTRSCPLGGTHYNSIEEAQKDLENKYAKEIGELPSLKKWNNLPDKNNSSKNWNNYDPSISQNIDTEQYTQKWGVFKNLGSYVKSGDKILYKDKMYTVNKWNSDKEGNTYIVTDESDSLLTIPKDDRDQVKFKQWNKPITLNYWEMKNFTHKLPANTPLSEAIKPGEQFCYKNKLYTVSNFITNTDGSEQVEYEDNERNSYSKLSINSDNFKDISFDKPIFQSYNKSVDVKRVKPGHRFKIDKDSDQLYTLKYSDLVRYDHRAGTEYKMFLQVEELTDPIVLSSGSECYIKPNN